jgi:hypothetical protein
MADSKIDFSFENLHFSCEGENTWVERQLNNVLSRIPALLSVHRKGENIVEEVIDVEEEEVNEVKPKAPHSDKKEAKVPKEKADKISKEKIAKPKAAKKPSAKSKLARKAKAAKTAKVTVAGEAQEVIEMEVVKRERKTKNIVKPAAKAKDAKKKIAKVSPVADQADSPLFRYIIEKKVVSNQVRKFLATAVFLARNNNLSKLSTPMISKTLKSYGIEKLQNASDCLNKNEKKGYCIKEGKEFIITENGYLSIE